MSDGGLSLVNVDLIALSKPVTKLTGAIKDSAGILIEPRLMSCACVLRHRWMLSAL